MTGKTKKEYDIMYNDYSDLTKTLYERIQKLKVELKDRKTPVKNLRNIEMRINVLYEEYLYSRDSKNQIKCYMGYCKYENGETGEIIPCV